MTFVQKSDKYLIFILPLIACTLLLFLNDNLLNQSIVLTILIYNYEMLIKKDYLTFGASGIRILSLPSILYLSYTFFIAIPSIFVPIIEDPTYIVPFYLSVMQFYIFFPIGLRVANHYLPINGKKIKNLYYSPFNKSNIDIYVYELLIILLTISSGLLILYLLRIKVIPLFVMISNPNAYLYLFTLREEAFKILEVTFLEKYLFSWLKSILFPIGIIGSLYLFKVYKYRRYLLLFLLFLILGLFNNSLTVAKAPTASLILSVIAFYYLYKKRFGLNVIVISIVLIFLFPLIVINLTNLPENRDPINLFTSILLRLFYIPVEALYQHFIVFPDKHPYLLGQGTNLISWMFNGGTFDVSNYVAKIWWNDPNTTGYANAIYIGGFWADFGLIGVCISTILIGLFSQLLYYKTLIISEYQKNIVYVLVTCSTIGIFTFSFISINFTTLLLTKGILIIVFMLIVIQKIKHFVSVPS